MQKQIKVQTGWHFQGKNIITENYSKIHYFPGGVHTSVDVRGLGWDEPVPSERMEDVNADYFKHFGKWDYEQNKTPECKPQFEVVVVETLNGKITNTEIKRATEPYFCEFEVEVEEPTVEDNVAKGLEKANEIAAKIDLDNPGF